MEKCAFFQKDLEINACIHLFFFKKEFKLETLYKGRLIWRKLHSMSHIFSYKNNYCKNEKKIAKCIRPLGRILNIYAKQLQA